MGSIFLSPRSLLPLEPEIVIWPIYAPCQHRRFFVFRNCTIIMPAFDTLFEASFLILCRHMVLAFTLV
jgi:hypothetical protein